MQFEKGVVYHIYNRSINKELLYKDEDNYRYFLQQFQYYLSGKVDVLAYCLMPTHFHFFIRATEESSMIETNFKALFITYAKAINKKYERTGSIFQAKYKKDKIADDKHFTNVIAYIHLNPVKANLCFSPDQLKFSSYNAITAAGNTNVIKDEVISWFGSLQNFIAFHKGYYDTNWLDKNLPD